MRVLLVSTYELGHQPLHVASPAGALLAEGHDVRALDLSVDDYDSGLVGWADGVAISVPMHTAMRLAVPVARRIRADHPGMPVVLYGLYAAMAWDRTVGAVAGRAIVGEYEPELLAWARDPSGTGVVTDLRPGPFAVPARDLLPSLDRYAHLQVADEHHLVGYVETSHGCRHRCRHCPIPAIYDGRFRVVDTDTVLSDIDQLVGMGARHVTFGDPDFLNGPVHAMRVLEAAHDRHPDLTFDLTIKVEHILEHRHLLLRMAESGVLFLVSAFESTDDRSLLLLDKGHTLADMRAALALCADAGMDIHPSWMPFMPWTEPGHVLDVFGFMDENGLFDVTDPVQLSIRLLVPDGSLILDLDEFDGEGYDPEALTHRWSAQHPATDALQQELAAAAAEAADRRGDPLATLVTMWELALAVNGRSTAGAQIPAGSTTGRPRMTEPWFC